MSDANRTRISIIEESIFGTTPGSAGYTPLRVTGASLGLSPRSAVSAELRSDRQIADSIRMGYEAGGSLPMEVSYGNLDTLIEGVLYSAWLLRHTTLRNSYAADEVITHVRANNNVDHATGNFIIGDLVRLSGFAKPQNNKIVRVSAATAAGATTFSSPGFSEEAAPPVGARMKKVGHSYPTSTFTIGGSVGSYNMSTTVSFGTSLGGLSLGEWIYLRRADGQPVSWTGWYRISAYDTMGIEFDITPAAPALGIISDAEVEIYVGDYVRNGVTPKSYTIEQALLDLTTPEYHYYKGTRVGSLGLTSEAQSIVGATAALVTSTSNIETVRGPGTPTDLPIMPFDVMHAGTVAGFILADGVQVAAPNYVMSTALSIEANLRRNRAMNVPGDIAIGAGRFGVTGTLGTYYGSRALLDKLRNNTATSFVMMISGGDGSVKDGYIIDIPRVKYATGDVSVPGVDTDRMLDLGFQGLRHLTLGYTIHIQRMEGFQL